MSCNLKLSGGKRNASRKTKGGSLSPLLTTPVDGMNQLGASAYGVSAYGMTPQSNPAGGILVNPSAYNPNIKGGRKSRKNRKSLKNRKNNKTRMNRRRRR